MKLKTSLQLSAIIPIVFAIAVMLLLSWRSRSIAEMDLFYTPEFLDTPFVATLGLLGVIMAAVVVAYTRGTLKKIRSLEAWTDNILKGDLDCRPEMVSANDEIGRLSAALGNLIRRVKDTNVVLQKQVEEQKREADEQKKSATSSQAGMRHMAQAIGRFKDAQEEVIQKERQRLLKQVVRGIIHDLSDALTPVLGAGDTVCAHPEMLKDPVWTLRQVESMHAGVQRARKSLKNLAGVFHQPQGDASPVDLNYVVKRGIELAEARRKDEGIAEGASIRIQTDLAKMVTVCGEETDITDAIVALVVNAMEAMPSGGIITVASSVEGTTAVLEVRDSGKGMSSEVRSRCLEPFYSTKKLMGAGMGLTTVASTVYRHRGSIEIESEAGRGTRVLVSLPLWRDRSATKLQATDTAHGTNLRILAVDDNAWARDAITAALKAAGHEAEAVADGHQALAKLKAEKYDVVFVDWAMPVMSGDRLAAGIKQILPKMPVIMLTAFGHAMIAEDNVPPAVDLMLLKPVTIDDMERAIAQAKANVGKNSADKTSIAVEDWDWSKADLK